MGDPPPQGELPAQRPRPRPRPIEEIKKDLDAVVEEYGALLDRLQKEAARQAVRRTRGSRSA